MVPVGVLLLVFAVAFGAGFLFSPGDSADIGFYGLMLQDLPARSLVILGIITGLIAALGAESIRWGTARWRRRRRIARKKEREFDTERDHAENSKQEPVGDGNTATESADAPPHQTLTVTATVAAPEPALGQNDKDGTAVDNAADENTPRP